MEEGSRRGRRRASLVHSFVLHISDRWTKEGENKKKKKGLFWAGKRNRLMEDTASRHENVDERAEKNEGDTRTSVHGKKFLVFLIANLFGLRYLNANQQERYKCLACTVHLYILCLHSPSPCHVMSSQSTLQHPHPANESRDVHYSIM